MKKLRGLVTFFKKLAALMVPYGRRRIALVWIIGVSQAILQVTAILMVMQFLSIALNPEEFLQSGWGETMTSVLPFVNSENIVLLLGCTAIAFLLANAGVGLLGDYARARFAHFTSMGLAVELLNHYSQKPYLFHVENNSAELIKRIQGDVALFCTFVLLPLLDTFTRVVIALGMILFLIALEPQAGLAAILVLGICYAAIFLITQPIFRKIGQEMNPLFSERFSSSQELLSGIKPLLVHQCTVRFLWRFRAAAIRLAKLQSRVPIFAGMPRYSLEALAFCGVIGLCLYFDQTGRSLIEIVPLLSAYAFAGYKLLPTVQLIYNQTSHIQTHMFTVDGLYNDLRVGEAPSQPLHLQKDTPMPERHVLARNIEFRGLNFVYPNAARTTLSNLSLTIRKGERVAFIGPSGSGKSPLVDILLGLLKVEPEQVLVDGRQLDGEFLRQWRQCVGYVPQEIFLIDATLAENIALGQSREEIDDTRLREVAEMAQLSGFINDELKDGFDTVTGERGVRLSGGQRQRVGLARALYHRPSVLILDEATSALDNTTEAQFVRAVDSLPGEMTIIAIAHRLSTVRNSDCLYFLREGKLLASGNFSELAEKCPEFRELAQEAVR
ncbi:MAG: ABC transporter ATP-binding protein [Opitutales bacterium]